jgi:hypothetical protein
LPSRIVSANGICGCGSTSYEDFFRCCQVLDLGAVYELEPNYSANNPCAPTRNDVIIDGECTIYPEEEPYGSVSLQYNRLCAKMVVWENATIEGSNLNFETRRVYYSRQRNGLPKFNGTTCERPIYCPPTNGLYECCTTIGGERPNGNSEIGGPYLNCTIEPAADEYSRCTLLCDSNFKEQIFKFGMSNCELEYEDQDSNSQNVILAGYAIDTNGWWFLSSDEFDDVVNQITDNNPNGNFPQTIYAHFQVEWKWIHCSPMGGIKGSPCNGAGRINYRDGRCGRSRMQGLVDKEERERAVRIKAAIGFSLGGCGFQPEKACEKIYEIS